MNAAHDAMSTERLAACPLCCATSWKKLPVPGRWIGRDVFEDLVGQIGLVQCRHCGLRFVNPRPSRERLHAFYSGDTYSCHEATGSSSAGSKADFVLQRIADKLPPQAPRSLLDYGAGGGAFLLHARNRGWRVQGFEPGRRGLESCRQSGLDVTDAWDDLSHNGYGLITMHHVLEHLADPIEVLGNIRSLLAPHGRLFVEVPNSSSLRARLAVPFLTGRFEIDERYRAFPIHLMYYSSRTLRRILAKAGWTTETTFTSGMGLEEFFIRDRTPRKRMPHSTESERSRSGPNRRLRRRLRDVYLGAGLGGDLAAIACPTPGCNR